MNLVQRRRWRALAVLGLPVLAAHGCVSEWMAGWMGEFGRTQAMPPRMEVVYVREMAPALPSPAAPAAPAAPTALPPPARHVAAVEEAASAPEAKGDSEAGRARRDDPMRKQAADPADVPATEVAPGAPDGRPAGSGADPVTDTDTDSDTDHPTASAASLPDGGAMAPGEGKGLPVATNDSPEVSSAEPVRDAKAPGASDPTLAGGPAPELTTGRPLATETAATSAAGRASTPTATPTTTPTTTPTAMAAVSAASTADSAAASSADPLGASPEVAGAAPFEWPVSTRVSYRLSGNVRGEVHGDAQVEWIREGSRYQVHLDVTVGLHLAPLMTRRMSSDGDITAAGLSPRRYDQNTRIGFNERRFATVLFEPDTVVLADGQRRERPAGLQDSASQFIQLSYLFGTRPDLLREGGSVEMPLALPRSTSRWVYDVVQKETVFTPIGPVDAFYLRPRRAVVKGGDLNAEIWFAPQWRYLPVRIRIRQDEETFVDLVIARKPQLAAR